MKEELLPGRRNFAKVVPQSNDENDPWQHPDMKLRLGLYDPTDEDTKTIGIVDAAEIMGMKHNSGIALSRVRKIIKTSGLFKPVDGGKNGINASKWEYTPSEMLDNEDDLGTAWHDDSDLRTYFKKR